MRLIALCLGIALAGVSVAGTSGAVRIVPAATPTAHWGSVRASAVSIPVVLPPGCNSAELTIVNLAGTTVARETFNADATYSWTVFSGASPKEEDFFTLTLVGKYGSTVLSTETATLALVKGAFGAVEARTDPSAPVWHWAGNNLVLPYSCKWSVSGETDLSLTFAKSGLDSVTNELAGTGWYGTRLKGTEYGNGDVSLALACGSDEWTAVIERLVTGTLLMFR